MKNVFRNPQVTGILVAGVLGLIIACSDSGNQTETAQGTKGSPHMTPATPYPTRTPGTVIESYYLFKQTSSKDKSKQVYTLMWLANGVAASLEDGKEFNTLADVVTALGSAKTKLGVDINHPLTEPKEGANTFRLTQQEKDEFHKLIASDPDLQIVELK